MEASPNPSERTPPKISPFRWAAWWMILAFALILFYGIFSIFWFGLRGAAWVAEFSSRRQRAQFARSQSR